MIYTKDIPTKPGFYWVKHIVDLQGSTEDQVVEVLLNPYKPENEKYLCVFVPGWECPENLDDYGQAWAGPLEPPTKSSVNKFKVGDILTPITPGWGQEDLEVLEVRICKHDEFSPIRLTNGREMHSDYSGIHAYVTKGMKDGRTFVDLGSDLEENCKLKD